MSLESKPDHTKGEGAQCPLATPVKLSRDEFPDRPHSPTANIPATYENFKHVLEQTGVTVRFNRIKKRPEVEVPGLSVDRQNRDAVILTRLESLFVRNGMSPGSIRSYLLALADENTFDPVADWISRKPWDGTSRLNEMYQTIIPADDYSVAFRDILMRKWLLSIVAATFKQKGFRARGVLTLQGAQGLGKTSWIARLVTPHALRDDVVKLGHSWDGGSKDARLGAIRSLIVELGELDGSFRKEMASLKAFITEENDKIRPPYGRVEAEYPRSTIFAASVNDWQFLTDTTGNSRFWTIPATKIDYEHNIDMQQVFAELYVAYKLGAQWWLTAPEENHLAAVNNEHRVRSAIEDKITETLDLDRRNETGLPKLTARQVLERLGIERPTNPQLKEANVALRTALGPHKRSGGYNRWAIPWRKDEPTGYDDEEDIY